MVPAAREALLDAASAALDSHPWSAVRMVEVAAAAGVSRQTLYNEFGTKDGLARALVRREADGFLISVDHALADVRHCGADAGDCVAAATACTLRTARRSALVRAALTGCRAECLPVMSGTPAEAQAGGLVLALRDRLAGALVEVMGGVRSQDAVWACEAAARLAVSYVASPALSDAAACDHVARLMRTLVTC